MPSRNFKYSKEQIEEMLQFAKDNNIGVSRMLKERGVNPRTFYNMIHRLGLSTDGVKASNPFNPRAMTSEQVAEVLEYAEANRVSHKKACTHFGYSYNTFRGAIVRLGVQAERFSSTYSKEDVERVFEHARSNHISLLRACKSLGFKYHLVSPSAKRYGLKFTRTIQAFDEAKAMGDREAVHFYMTKGYAASEIFHALKQSGRKLSRGMIYYYYKENSPIIVSVNRPVGNNIF